MPVQVGVLESHGEVAGPAARAGLPVRRLAQEQLGGPQSEPLLAHTSRAVQKERPGEGARLERARQDTAGVLVSPQWMQCHVRPNRPCTRLTWWGRARNHCSGSWACGEPPPCGARTWNSM